MATKTFLFVDQVGSTEQLALLGDSTAQGVRRALFDLLRQATEVAGGREVDFTGDGLFCAFDGAAEAVDAAISMQQLVWSFNGRRPEPLRVEIRVGLNSGEPLESESGGYFGTAVVVAARLCSAAVAGQVLVSPLVRGLVEPLGLQRLESIGPLDLKGVPGPIDASALVWEPDQRQAPGPTLLADAGTTPFVGRRHELLAVDAAWARTGQGVRQLVAISGDHGVGVTRLAAEAARRLHDRGASVWAGHGQGADARLAPWAEAIAEWAATIPRAELRLALGERAADMLRLLPGLAELVPRLPAPLPVDPSAELFLIADAVDDLVARWSAVEPLVVVLDDLDEADQGTLTVLRRVANSHRGGRVLLIAGYEPSSVGTPRVLATLQDAAPSADLRLSGLTEDDALQLVQAVTGGPVDARSLRALLAESEGMPYFVLEMARSLKERGLSRKVYDAVDQAGELRADLRLQREEITLALRELEQLRESGPELRRDRLDPDGTPPTAGSSPYRGLLAFRGEDADAFFGRDALIAEMVAGVASSRWLAVVGPSGSGKSSAVRAGLLPMLARGALPGSAYWASAVCTPGPEPLAALAGALHGGAPSPAAIARLEHEPLAALAADRNGDRRTVLVVDQFEELWTVAPEAARGRVLDLLVEAASGVDERVLVVLCLRADYYGRTAEHSALAGLLAQSQVLVSPMTTGELRAAVELPAQRGGWALEPGLTQAVLDDVEGEPGALPLLSTAMLETWERRRGRSLTLAAYAETGGARGAIASLADSALDELDEADQAVARRLLLRLAAPTAEGTDVARPARLSELAVDDATRRVLDRLAERRLVTVGRSTAQVAHEALLREWPRLRAWLEADRDGRRLHQQIATAASDWAAAARDDGLLVGGARLAAAADWRGEHEPELTRTEREYLDASVASRDRDLRRARRTTRRFQVLAGVLVVLLVGAAVATGLAVVRSRESADRAAVALGRGLAAQAIAIAGTSLDTALLLAAEGYRRDPSTDTENGLLSALNAARYLTRYRSELPRETFDTALSPDGRTLAVLTASGDLRLFDAVTWRERGEPLIRGIATPTFLQFDPSGSVLAYTAGDGVHLVDVRTGKPTGPALGGEAESRAVFSTDGTVVAVDSGVQGSTFRIVDRRTGIQLSSVPAETGAIRPGADEAAISLPGGQTIVQRTGFDGSPIGSPVTLPGDGGYRLAYTPDGRRLLVTSASGLTAILDAETLTPVGQAIGAVGPQVDDVDLSPHGNLVAVALETGTVLVASATDGSPRATITGLGQGPAVTFLDDHRLLASTQERSAEYDLRRLTQIGIPTVLPDPISRLLPVPGSDRYLTGQGPDLVEVDVTGRQFPTGVRLPLETEGPMALSPDGGRIAALGYPLGYHYQAPPDPGLPEVPIVGVLVVADRDTGRVLFRSTATDDGGYPAEGAIAFSPDGRRLAVGTWAGVVTILDSATGQVLAQRKTDYVGVRALRWSPAGTVLYEGGGDGILRFLDPRTAQPEAEVRLSQPFGLNSIAAVPQARLLAVASDAGGVFFVDPLRRTMVDAPLAAQAAQLLALAASPDGSRIAAVGWDGALRLWDRSSGRAIGPPLDASGDYTRSIAWPDDKRLLTGTWRGDNSGVLISWDMAPADWLHRACALAGRDLTPTEWQRYLPDQPYRRTCTTG